MDIERSIITICAMNPEVAYPEAIDSALTPELFEGEAKEVWAFAERFLKTHGRGPSVDAIQSQFISFEPSFPTEPLSYYIEQLKRKYAFNLTIEAIKNAHKHLSAREVEEAVSQLSEAMRHIQDTTSSEADLNWRESTKDRYDHYLNLKNIGGIDGYTTPFPSLDEATQGIHDGEFILIVARQGVGKTWLSNVLAHENLKKGLKVLYFTKEMPSRQIARRFDALVYDLPYQDLRRGTLDSFRQTDWQAEINAPSKIDGELYIVGEESGGVGHVAAKIERYKPDIVYIDGMYLMEDDQRAREQWQRIGNISRDLKRLAKRVNIPILATVQFNRNADNSSGDTANIAGSDIAKDADLILGLFQTEDQRLARRMTLKVLKQREGSRPEIECDWDMEAMRFCEAEESDDSEGISW